MKVNNFLMSIFQTIILIVLPVIIYSQAITLTLLKTIESPRQFFAGSDDKGGYWKDYGTTREFDFYPGTNMLAALIQETNGKARLYVYDMISGQKINEVIVSDNTRNISSFG